ncbi:MarR family transcriptional regulator [Aurantimonas sp. MSK8Z-1]|uniref:MarR family winged helix-turn-helix transcriptional regulator n=1 Tax=Mangrovibrevibacter kandeliae TaxID=2968473 RepID=UPI00211872F1|nr:MarR family transcriptional regulator [Aurantimonas sp. MSK8Z-1]MCW4113921.1 MarR family transcriptional regulator [Aurantimonas sp. MSK8Z-1]
MTLVADDASLTALAAELHGLVGRLRRRLREEATAGDLTPSQFAVMRRLESDGPATVSELARAENMRPQSMSGLIAALQALGMVEGAPHPTDGRQTLLSLTDDTRTRLTSGREIRKDWLARTLGAEFSASEQAQIAAAVELLKRIVDS